MNGEMGRIAHRMGRILAWYEADDLVPHPLKRFSRQFLAVGVGGAALLHVMASAGTYLHSLIDRVPLVEIEIVPYPEHLIEIINPDRLITTERGGARPGRFEPPADSADDILTRGAPVPVVVAIPEPVDHSLIAEEHEVAAQEEIAQSSAVAVDAEDEPDDEAGQGGTGVDGTASGGTGTGGSSGLGDGGDGTWRYDTRPIPRRLNMNISRKEIPRNLRHVKDSIVKFELLIDEQGRVVDAAMIESTGYPEIDQLLLEKVYTSRYHPATLKQRPVKAWIAVGYGYKVGG